MTLPGLPGPGSRFPGTELFPGPQGEESEAEKEHGLCAGGPGPARGAHL